MFLINGKQNGLTGMIVKKRASTSFLSYLTLLTHVITHGPFTSSFVFVCL